jgi:hypothetical protein
VNPDENNSITWAQYEKVLKVLPFQRVLRKQKNLSMVNIASNFQTPRSHRV